MKTRILTVATMLCIASIVSSPAEAKKKRDIQIDVSFGPECAVFAHPKCVKVGKYNVTGSGILPGQLVSGIGKVQKTVSPCPGIPLKVSSFKVVGICLIPGPLPKS